MKRPTADTLLIAGSLLLTVFLVWFALSGYLSAVPVAQSLLRGLALSLGQAIESVAGRDPTLRTLSDFRSRDIAYYALIDKNGRFRFHQNQDLVGEQVGDNRYLLAFDAATPLERRIRLGTGEEAYECHLPLHLGNEVLALRLVLHTWQADQIIRRARTGAVILMLLTVSGWVLGFLLMRAMKREAGQRETLARQEQLARLGELGAVLAHEVRTPLAGIKGYAQLLEERPPDSRTAKFSALIVQETLRLEGLVNDLLDYVRQDETASGVSCRLDVALYDAWGLVSSTADANRVLFEQQLEPGLQLACSCDQLRRLLLNLLSNALQVMPSGGDLRLTAIQRQAVAVITIADSGPGFAKEALERCFDPFYTTRANGSGLGLAICRKIAEGCGGTITAENGTAGGAVITVRLPCVSGGSDDE